MVSHNDIVVDMRNSWPLVAPCHNNRLIGGCMFASIRRFHLVWALVPGLVAISAAAWAQAPPSGQGAAADQNEPSDKLEEVVVTARKRSESFQDVPIAV